MSVLENFKNIPRSPYEGATGPKCNFFFFKFATKSLKKKRRGLSPTPEARGCLPRPGHVSTLKRKRLAIFWPTGETKKRGCHCGSMEPVTAFRLFVLLSGNDLWWGLEPVTAGSACLFLLRILFRSQILHPNTQIHHIECLDTYIKY